MTAPVELLTVLVLAATLAASATPVLLVALWVRDLRRGRLW